MTHTQQPPQMPPEPLDEAERALARALRNLPVGSPPPELDARILGAARRAVHAAPPRKRSGRHWLIGFGTAASALLAIGLVLKTHGPAPAAILVPPADNAAPSAEGTAADAKTEEMPAAAAARDEMRPNAEAQRVFPPPPPMAIKSPAVQKDIAPEAADKPLSNRVIGHVSNPPRAFPAPVVISTPTPMSIPPPPPAPPAPPLRSESIAPPPAPAAMAAPQPSPSLGEFKKEQPSSNQPPGAAQPVAPPAQAGGMAGTVAPSVPSDERDAAAGNAAMQSAQSTDQLTRAKSLDSVEVTGSKVRRADAKLPALSADATLNPPEWIERIRERVHRGDRAGAAQSLHAFMHAYPHEIVPDDLLPLLQ